MGAAGPDGGFAEDPGQVAGAVSGAAVAFLAAGGLADPRSKAGPGRQMRRVGNRDMSRPLSAMIACAAVTPILGISSSRATTGEKGAI